MKSILTILISFGLAFSVFGQTRNVVVGTNGAIVQPTNFWSADASNARTGLGLGDSATNPASAFQSSSSVLSNLASSNAINLTNVRATNIIGTVSLATNVSGIVAIANGGTAATTAGAARTNLGLGATWLTNTVSSNFRSDIGMPWINLTNNSASNFFQQILTTSDESAYPRIPATQLMAAGSEFNGIDPTNYPSGLALKYVSTPDDGYGGIPPDHDTWTVTSPSKFRSAIEMPLSALTNVNNSNFRSAIGLSFSALTNTNTSGFNASLYGSGTNPVLVDTSGYVVSPTNFWQVAPIQTLVQSIVPVTNSTNAATNARNLYVYSLATNVVGVTNTITLPTNTSSFDGDEVTVIHRGGSNSVTAVRQLGSTNNLISLNSYDESVKFIKDGNWDFYHNISFTEAIRFSGTNAAANAAASVTNLFTPNTPLVFTTNGQVVANTGTNPLTFTNRPLLKGLDTTNIPALFWQTSDGIGDGAVLAFSRRHATNLWFGINQTNWSQGAWGQNIQPTSDGNNFTRKNTNLGSVALVLENEYNAEQNTNNPPLTVAEMYFDVTDVSGQRIRPLMFVGSQTNSALGWGYSVYPLTVGVTNLGWNAASAFQVDYNNPSGGGTMVLKNLSTSGGSYAELQMVSGGGTALILQKQNRFDLYANNVSYGNIIQALTNGVVIGSSSFKTEADARVQLGGDTRIDGAISFNATSNAATTRTNLGLGATNDVIFSNVTASGTLTSTGAVTALSNVAVTGTLTATSTVTAKTNLVVEGFVDYTAARTNNTPTNTPNFAAHAAWIEVKIGTNSFFLPAYQ